MGLTTIVLVTTGKTELITAQEYVRVEYSIGQYAYFQGYNNIDSEYVWCLCAFNDAFMMYLSIVYIYIYLYYIYNIILPSF